MYQTREVVDVEVSGATLKEERVMVELVERNLKLAKALSYMLLDFNVTLQICRSPQYFFFITQDIRVLTSEF